MKALSTLKAIVAVAVILCMAIFILQNREILELRFLSWRFETRRAYMLLVVLGAGLGLGWIIATLSQLTARGREAHVERPPDDFTSGPG
jgi:uncharacterized integral membrane protein